jgi:putative transposase
MLLGQKIRLQVSEADAAALEFMQGKCRALCHWRVMRLRDGDRWPGRVEAKASLRASKEHDPELDFVYDKLVHEIDSRLDRALVGFFRRVAAVETPGGPRVRPRPAFFTLCYPAMYVTVEGDRLTLATGGGGKSGIAKRYPNIVARLTQLAPTDYREVAISRDARGHCYASFVSAQPDAPLRSGGALAFDLGIKTLAPGVNEQGRVYRIGGFKGHQWHNHPLDKRGSQRDHCQKRARSYIHLNQVYQRVSERKRNNQRDGLRKATQLIASRLLESTVVIGDLSQRQMVMNLHQEKYAEQRRRLHRAVCNDWGLYRFVSMVEYKCRRFGTESHKESHRMDERYTSQDCSPCAQRQATPLWKRTSRRGTRGPVMDRDKNSAITIRERCLARRGPHTGASVRCAAPQSQHSLRSQTL